MVVVENNRIVVAVMVMVVEYNRIVVVKAYINVEHHTHFVVIILVYSFQISVYLNQFLYSLLTSNKVSNATKLGLVLF